MSYTVVRKRNGKEEAIKVSILDALRSRPPPKKEGTYVKCRRCKTVHMPGSKVLPNKKSITVDAKLSDKPKENKPEGKEGEKSFTKDEDQKLRDLKKDSKTWREIAEVLKKSQGDCRARWKVIDPAKKDDKKTEGDFWKDKSKDSDKKEDKKEQSASAKLTKKQKKEAKAEAKKDDGRTEERKAGDKSESNANPAVKSEDHKWEAAAAKHFDKTGVRITPQQAREMAEEKK